LITDESTFHQLHLKPCSGWVEISLTNNVINNETIVNHL